MRRRDDLALRKVQSIWPFLQVPQVRVHRSLDQRKLILMAKVMVSVKLFPSEPNTNMIELKDQVTKSLEGRASVYKFEEEPIAFGLVALIAHVLLPEDAGGQMEDLEERLKSVSGINEVQVLVSRRV